MASEGLEFGRLPRIVALAVALRCSPRIVASAAKLIGEASFALMAGSLRLLGMTFPASRLRAVAFSIACSTAFNFHIKVPFWSIFKDDTN